MGDEALGLALRYFRLREYGLDDNEAKSVLSAASLISLAFVCGSITWPQACEISDVIGLEVATELRRRRV